MTRFVLHLMRGGHQNEHAKAVSTGMRHHGFHVVAGVLPQPGDVVVCWGWRVGQRYRQIGLDVLVLERGYLGDRFRWTSIAFNGLNGRGEFPAYPDDGGARFRQHHGHLLKPWRPGGEYVLLCGQVPGDASLQGRDLSLWYARAARDLAAAHGLPVRWRPHPIAVRRGQRLSIPGTQMDLGPLDEALGGAARVATWNSNSGVDALLAGKPASCADEGSMISGWDGTDKGRLPLLHVMAWKQWSLDEIATGVALAGVADRVRGS